MAQEKLANFEKDVGTRKPLIYFTILSVAFISMYIYVQFNPTYPII